MAKIERQLGLDKPLPVQLVRWYGRLLQGDLGRSIFLRNSCNIDFGSAGGSTPNAALCSRSGASAIA